MIKILGKDYNVHDIVYIEYLTLYGVAKYYGVIGSNLFSSPVYADPDKSLQLIVNGGEDNNIVSIIVNIDSIKVMCDVSDMDSFFISCDNNLLYHIPKIFDNVYTELLINTLNKINQAKEISMEIDDIVILKSIKHPKGLVGRLRWDIERATDLNYGGAIKKINTISILNMEKGFKFAEKARKSNPFALINIRYDESTFEPKDIISLEKVIKEAE